MENQPLEDMCIMAPSSNRPPLWVLVGAQPSLLFESQSFPFAGSLFPEGKGLEDSAAETAPDLQAKWPSALGAHGLQGRSFPETFPVSFAFFGLWLTRLLEDQFGGKDTVRAWVCHSGSWRTGRLALSRKDTSRG